MARTTATNRTDSTARVADGYRLNRQEHSPSASFNGSSTGITLGFKANSTGFTIAAWIKVRRFTSGDRIFDQQDSGPSKGFAVLMPVTASDRSLYFSVFGDSSEEANIKIALNIWEWTHIAISFEPNSAKFYKNGVLAGTDTSVSLGDSVTNLVIGKNASSAANYFNGLMKDFVVYDRVLSLAEVENVRDGIVSQTNLKCYLPLSSDLADISVNGNDGTGTAVFTYTNDSPFYDAVGLNMYAPLKSSLLLERGVGYPTWSRATKAWGFNELGYLEELASGCAFFGGARLVRNLCTGNSDNFSGATLGRCSIVSAAVANHRGTDTAVKYLLDTTAGVHYARLTSSAYAGMRIRVSVVVKRDEYQYISVRSGQDTTPEAFNLTTNTWINSAQAETVARSFEVIDATWIRLTVASTVSTGVRYFGVGCSNSLGSDSWTPGGTENFTIADFSICDVTGYDASYVPEYVSVGVLSAPFHGAGIDGAKYFETDWQGAPLPAASLLGFRREEAATNNVLHCRDLTKWGGPGASSKIWQTPAAGSEVVSNWNFDSDLTGWTTTVGSGDTISAAGGQLTVVFSGTVASSFAKSSTLTIGTAYTMTIVATGTGQFKCTSVTSEITGITAGTNVISFVADKTSISFSRIASTACNLVIDSISVRPSAVQPSRTATGLDGIANTATTLTASAADAIILQSITLASAARCASAFVKRRTGTGTISFTQDGGSSWTDITSQINGSTWSRVQITSTLANPSVGFKISTSGDAIDVDCVQNEAGSVATSPIITTSATVTRNAESLTYQTAGNIDFAVGTVFAKVLSNIAASTRGVVYVGSSYFGTTSGSATTSFRINDGTTNLSKSGLSNISTESRKRVGSWGPAGLSVTGDGLAPATDVFDGSFGNGASISIGENLNGYIGPVAIWNYQMTDAELQALTT